VKPKNKSSENQTSEIPKTGRIGRLAENIEKETNRAVLQKVMQGVDQFESTSNYTIKAAWWKGAIERLEKLVGKEISIKIMEICGRKCCGPTHRKHVKQFMSESKSIEEFLDKLNKRGIGGGRFKLEDKNTIVGGYDKCYCGQVKQTKEPFSTGTYCQCGVGWIKQLFESALEKPVDVELAQSIITGAESCEFVIHIK